MTTSTNDQNAKQNRKRRNDRRRAPGYEWVDRRIQVALLGTIGRPFA
jgi:hypothetical protein